MINLQNRQKISHYIEVLETDDSVSSVFINIFGGITRCDLVAQGIVEATKANNGIENVSISFTGLKEQIETNNTN